MKAAFAGAEKRNPDSELGPDLHPDPDLAPGAGRNQTFAASAASRNHGRAQNGRPAPDLMSPGETLSPGAKPKLAKRASAAAANRKSINLKSANLAVDQTAPAPAGPRTLPRDHSAPKISAPRIAPLRPAEAAAGPTGRRNSLPRAAGQAADHKAGQVIAIPGAANRKKPDVSISAADAAASAAPIKALIDSHRILNGIVSVPASAPAVKVAGARGPAINAQAENGAGEHLRPKTRVCPVGGAAKHQQLTRPRNQLLQPLLSRKLWPSALISRP